MRSNSRPFLIMCLVTQFVAAIASGKPAAAETVRSLLSQTVYTPAYSRVFLTQNRSELVAATLTVHNVDPERTIQIDRVDYHDQDGKIIKSFIDTEITLPPFASKDFLVPMNDTTGGTGANFLMVWSSERPALEPIVEALIIGGSGTAGLAFTTTGKIIGSRAAE
ncbi:hypothetical protein GCM10011316_21790 [Roseibium aquae]|uniref:DUF3124 domain-containing protein n=1 Tax=Roseibium aquae TaxID=1323746 RepID=A0A916TJV1_9HYPH|nr:DUF3124 domain-containing protein [Roseibium aquae]GGB49293.1 hypothetical protein GCM10011316_21790 [Roseibium aquae]